jgi:hypothetical protein
MWESNNRLKVIPRNQGGIIPLWLSAICVLVFLSSSGCAKRIEIEQKGVFLDQPISHASDPREILSGMWEYHEGEVMYEVFLDRQGNGTYDWQQGRFETTSLQGKMWKGLWIQAGNDREGGFEAQLEEGGMAAHGRWWYTRIGNDYDPLEPGGQFILMRTAEIE